MAAVPCSVVTLFTQIVHFSVAAVPFLHATVRTSVIIFRVAVIAFFRGLKHSIAAGGIGLADAHDEVAPFSIFTATKEAAGFGAVVRFWRATAVRGRDRLNQKRVLVRGEEGGERRGIGCENGASFSSCAELFFIGQACSDIERSPTVIIAEVACTGTAAFRRFSLDL
ncbi:MAG: hypothetical protein WCS85_00025 [Candidatus Peribacteraceae bacterium]|jgi:hypothetical protein